MTTPDETQLGFDEVLDRVLAADPDTFYRKAQAFDEAATVLHDVKDVLARHRRSLDELWSNSDLARLARLDKLTAHLELLLSRMRHPSYSRTLRRIGDVIRDSQRRLLSMKDDRSRHGDDPAARADRDRRARKILSDLSGSYRQLGDLLQELPERTADGALLPGSFAHTAGPGEAPAPVSAGTSAYSAKATATKTHPGAGTFGTVATEAKLTGDGATPSAPASFAGFAHYATQPASQGHGKAVPSFTGFAGMADPRAQAAAVAVTKPVAAPSSSPKKMSEGEERVPAATSSRIGKLDPHVSAATSPSIGKADPRVSPTAAPGIGKPDQHVQVAASPGIGKVDQHVPLSVKLESVPGAGLPVQGVPVTTAGPVEASVVSSPGTASAATVSATTVPTVTTPAVTVSAATSSAGTVPAVTTASATTPQQLSLTGSAARASAPLPAAPEVPAARPLPPGPPPAAAATNAPVPALALTGNANVASDSAIPGGMMRSGLTPAPLLAATAPAPSPRGAEVWLRADTSTWNPECHGPTRLGREDIPGHDPAGYDDATARGKDAQ